MRARRDGSAGELRRAWGVRETNVARIRERTAQVGADALRWLPGEIELYTADAHLVRIRKISADHVDLTVRHRGLEVLHFGPEQGKVRQRTIVEEFGLDSPLEVIDCFGAHGRVG